MNPAAILALISELYGQVAQLRQENDVLREQLAAAPAEPHGSSPTRVATCGEAHPGQDVYHPEGHEVTA